jgi:hypothetical protein
MLTRENIRVVERERIIQFEKEQKRNLQVKVGRNKVNKRSHL